MKRKDVDLFEKLSAQLSGLQQELSLLAKKSPSDAVNPFKLNLINKVLQQCNDLLGEQYRPFHDFGIFSSDDVPSTSDVTFILSQYIECAEKFRSDNIENESGWWYWKLDDSGDAVRTSSPKKLSNK